MFTLTLASGRAFRVRKSNERAAWNVARALARRHACTVEVVSDVDGWVGVVGGVLARHAAAVEAFEREFARF
jgi:hypothetical protein